MRISYTARAIGDLRWYDRYYKQVFPEGAQNAHEHYMRGISMLLRHPQIGQLINTQGTREWNIPKTPFSLVYRIGNDSIIVLRVWDNRRDQPES
jgi:plasmid stabilization system protein ParE